MREASIRSLLAGLALAVALVVPASAGASVTIGQTGPVGIASCNPNGTWIQDATAPGSPSYVVPAGGGVITSWSHDRGAAAATAQLRLKVFRPIGPSTYLTVGHSDFETLAAPGDNTFPTRIPVQAGDHLGFRLGSDMYSCRRGGVAGDVLPTAGGPDPDIGTTVTFSSPFTALLNLAATIEPDADNDGFGDETQDGCPNNAAIQQPPCDTTPPDTTITKGPKDKTKKKQATFEFGSNEPGVTFECALDGGPFAACTSPDTLKVKKGKHHFEVRATDATGNVDGSPATDDWKVKKKK